MKLLTLLGSAFLGGLILNIMPCVLPVLTIKAFHVVEQSKQSAHERRMSGLGYVLGTTLFFVLGAILVVVLKAGGARLGWGMQFRNPAFVAFLITLVFAMGLNSLGVFELTISASGGEEKGGFVGAVFNGIFAALMGTPCSAPFLGGAAAYALGSEASAPATFAIFATIGIGLGSPYLALTLIPKLGKVLPKPGPWMESFKQLMGFTLLGVAVWLFDSFQKQVNPDSLTRFLSYLVAVGVALWAVGRFATFGASAVKRWGIRVAAGVVIVAGSLKLGLAKPQKPKIAADTAKADCKPAATGSAKPGDKAGKPKLPPVVKNGHIAWTAFNTKRIKLAHSRGRPVFMDFTADWCASCKTNEKVFLETDTVRNTLKETQILPVKCDMTNENDELDDWLDRLKRSGIPVYVVYMPNGDIDLLPIAITADMVKKHLKAASAKFPASKFKSGVGGLGLLAKLSR